MSSGGSLVQETADCIDEVIQSQAPEGGPRQFSGLLSKDPVAWPLSVIGLWIAGRSPSKSASRRIMQILVDSTTSANLIAAFGVKKASLRPAKSLEGLFDEVRRKFQWA
jgi:hypothetical protein